MAAKSKPMLFAPPDPPFLLNEMRPFVMGRNRDCDFPISIPEASRRHAEILFRNGQFFLRDLGSTNGTYVNGKRLIVEHLLYSGDRIEIGPLSITFCQITDIADRNNEPVENTATMIFNRKSVDSSSKAKEDINVFQGDLSEIPTFAVLQVLEMSSNTGVLRITSQNFIGSIWIEKGAPVHAEVDGSTGFDAAAKIVMCKSGRFSFESSAKSDEHTITVSVTGLLLEAARLADEAARDRK